MKYQITVTLLLIGTCLLNMNLIAEDQPVKQLKNLEPKLVKPSELSVAEEPDKNADKRFLESFKKWENFKKSKKGNYTYTVAYTSMLMNNERTVIVVEDNKVVERKYYDSKGKYVYTEKADKLGSNKRGARAVTIDVWYASAKNSLSDGSATLSYNRNNGFLTYIRPTGDSCPSYYRIDKIE